MGHMHWSTPHNGTRCVERRTITAAPEWLKSLIEQGAAIRAVRRKQVNASYLPFGSLVKLGAAILSLIILISCLAGKDRTGLYPSLTNMLPSGSHAR